MLGVLGQVGSLLVQRQFGLLTSSLVWPSALGLGWVFCVAYLGDGICPVHNELRSA